MSESLRVAVLVGSLRAGSFSRKIAHALMARAPRAMACKIIEIGNLALYNEDLERGAPPAAWSEFRSEIRNVDAVLFVTPEYNRSVPACVKNAIDVGSRPSGQSVFDGMPAGVVSVTPYKLGAFGANHALRQTFVFLNMPAMQQPEVYVGKVADLLDQEGKIKDDDTSKLFEKFMKAFDLFVKTIRAGDKSRDFEAFMKARLDVARDYVNGDASSLGPMLTSADPATFLSPKGDVEQGAMAVSSRYKNDAKSFHRGSSTELEILQSAVSGNLAFWTGLQRADAVMGKDGKKVSMTLRITEVFRFEDGAFKLVHRHADPGGEKP